MSTPDSGPGVAQPHPVAEPAHWCARTCRHLDTTHRWAADDLAAQLPLFTGWMVEVRGGFDTLTKTFRFADFNALEPAVLRLMAIARLQDHHPDVTFGYRDLTVGWSTHSAGGVSDNDWICAALFEAALNGLTTAQASD